ncbi:unnamed protein product [Strongylus vulgaris]|uniref:Uncharacterized protein n=1 Tax=Strongylus vulgaris TaxID=40348 RepID=A0A3P7LBH5_STRVU|nr:unnamed protein product [Strongylus vulgaris]
MAVTILFKSNCCENPIKEFVISGDITQKGYEKKRNLILAKYNKGCSAGRLLIEHNTCHVSVGLNGICLIAGDLNLDVRDEGVGLIMSDGVVEGFFCWSGFPPYVKLLGLGPGQSKGSPGTRAHRQHQRRLTRDEARFHSDSSSDDDDSLVGSLKRKNQPTGKINAGLVVFLSY